MIFSGPIQPPMLGSAIASAKLHLSEPIETYQNELAELIDYTNQKIVEFNLPQVEINNSPIFFIPVGLIQPTHNFVGKVIKSSRKDATPFFQCSLQRFDRIAIADFH